MKGQDMSEIPGTNYAKSPADIRATAEGIVATYGFNAALLEGAICAALLSEREAATKADTWAGSAPFITSESGGGQYAVRVKVHSMDELHAAHTLILKAFGAKL